MSAAKPIRITARVTRIVPTMINGRRRPHWELQGKAEEPIRIEHPQLWMLRELSCLMGWIDDGGRPQKPVAYLLLQMWPP
ncbi:unnamed protein product, partial [Vitis vinifera]